VNLLEKQLSTVYFKDVSFPWVTLYYHYRYYYYYYHCYYCCYYYYYYYYYYYFFQVGARGGAFG